MSYYPAEPTMVILYTMQQFQDITRSAAWSKGVYDGKIRVPIGGGGQKPDLLKKVLFHEYAHAVVHGLSRGMNVPTWFNEGVAVYLESSGGSSREQDLYRRVQSGTPLVPLSGLHGSFMGLSDAQASLAYAESYAAVKALVDRYGLYRVRRLVPLYAGGIDFSPIIVFVAILFLQQFLVQSLHDLARSLRYMG